jgi:hypothetical protein
MENAYYFSQGRLIYNTPYNTPYNKFGDNKNNDIEMGIAKEDTKEAKDTNDNRDKWYNIAMFRNRKFHIFSASILRYK